MTDLKRPAPHRPGAPKRFPDDERMERRVAMPKALFHLYRQLAEVLGITINELMVGMLIFGADYLVKLSHGESPVDLHSAFQAMLPDPEQIRETA